MNKEKAEKLEKHLEISAYLCTTVCLIVLYCGISLYDQLKPAYELNAFKILVRTAGQHPTKFVRRTKADELTHAASNTSARLTDSVKAQLGYRLDWGLVQRNEFQNLLLVEAPKYVVGEEEQLGFLITELSRGAPVYQLASFRCKPNRQIIPPTNAYSYYNVTQISEPTKAGPDSAILSLSVKMGYGAGKKIVLGRSEDAKLTALGEGFTLTCTCKRKRNLAFGKASRAWFESAFPWISDNLPVLSGEKLSNFNRKWESGLTKTLLSNEQEVAGIKIQNFSLPTILICSLLLVFIFHLSVLEKLLTDKPKGDSFFALPILFNNTWSFLLRVIVWLLLPAASLATAALLISGNKFMLFWLAPILALGGCVVVKIKKIVAGNVALDNAS
jgi:hypothetical protein